jgi:Domain of unknown function (DUF4263)
VTENDLNTKHDEFIALLDRELPEQHYQDYLEQNTRFVPREFVQNHGIHLSLVLRKLSLAADYTTDFFYLSKSSVSWNCVLIEIEKPESQYFRIGSNEFHPNFLSALSQISRWRAWFDNNSNLNGFVDGTIASLRVPMKSNPCRIKYVLIHGRRSEYEGNEIRMSLIRAQARDEDFRIMSFDALAEALTTKEPLYLGVRKNEHIEIRSKDFLEEALFAWVNPASLCITPELRQNIESARGTWHTYRRHKVLVLDEVLPKIGICTT